LQEQGTVAIRFTIGVDGNVNECAVTTPSGKPRLDDAACVFVKRKWKYKPATLEGKPVAQNSSANVVFQLR
jgi:protein TonB